jgi:hypothetical protein
MLDIEIGILSKNISFTREDKDILLRQIFEYLPEFSPQKYGDGERYRFKFDSENIDDALDFWDKTDNFYWKRIKPKSEGSFHSNHPIIHSRIYLNGQYTRSLDSTKLVRYLHEVSISMSTDFSYLHLFSDQELDNESYEMLSPFRHGVITYELRKYLPNLCWANIFGSSYIELFGRDILLSTPAYLVSEIAENTIYLQLTEDIYDLKTNYAEVDAVRQKAKKHLDNNIFFNPSHDKKHKYNIPKFPLEIPSSAGREALDKIIEAANEKTSRDIIPSNLNAELKSVVDNLGNQLK